MLQLSSFYCICTHRKAAIGTTGNRGTHFSAFEHRHHSAIVMTNHNNAVTVTDAHAGMLTIRDSPIRIGWPGMVEA